MTPSDRCEITLCCPLLEVLGNILLSLGGISSLYNSEVTKMGKNCPFQRAEVRLTSFGMVSSWEPVCAEASIPAEDTVRESQWARWATCWKTTSVMSTYLGSPGCYVQWGRGSAAWPAGVVWWAVECGERMWRAQRQYNEKEIEDVTGLKFCNGLSGASGRSDDGRET